MCNFAFRVKDLSNNQEINIEIAGQIDFCNYPVGTIVKVTAKQTIECAEIIIAGTNCEGIVNPCSDDPNDFLQQIGEIETGYEYSTLEIVTSKYVLIDCAGILPITQSTEAGLEFYLDKVIKTIPADPDEGTNETCLLVQKELCTPPYPTFNLGSVVITDYFPTCIECLTVKPTTTEEVKKRTVNPGYDTPGCSPEYYDKISCKFSETVYQEIVKKRYGIDFCCEDDADKWDVKKELLYLAAKTDPDICETICPTNTVECNILCLNVDTCDLDFNTFTQFVTNGSADMTDLIVSYLDYELTDPILYAELDYFNCLYDETYCLPLCFYTANCYALLAEVMTAFGARVKKCTELAEAVETALIETFIEKKQTIEECIEALTKITLNIETLQPLLLECQEELQALIDAGAPQEEILAKEKECDSIARDILSLQDELEYIQEQCANTCGCSGTIEELESYLVTITTRRSLGQQFYADYIIQVGELGSTLTTILSLFQACSTCDTIFPALYGGLITYTTCNGSEISMPLTPFLKIYSQVTSSYVYSNDSYELNNYQDLMSSIITISEECDALPECAENTNLPNCSS